MKKLISFGLFLLTAIPLLAQENLTYQKPPQEILELADVRRAPSVSMDSKHENMLLTSSQ